MYMRWLTREQFLDMVEVWLMTALLTGLGYLVVLILSGIFLHTMSIEGDEPVCRSEVGGRVPCASAGQKNE